MAAVVFMVTIMMVMISGHSLSSTSRPGSISEHLRDADSGAVNAFELCSEDGGGGDGENSLVVMLVVEMMTLFLLDCFQRSWLPSPQAFACLTGKKDETCYRNLMFRPLSGLPSYLPLPSSLLLNRFGGEFQSQ